MSIKDVIKEGDPRLAIASSEVKAFGTAGLITLIDDMKETMREENGVGIAAPQIGVNLRVVIVGFERSDRYPGQEPLPEIAIVNPKIDIIDTTLEEDWEGCLSVPGVRGLVPRFRGIRCSGFDVEGNPISFEATGFHARIVQHEVDHLDGILFTARVEKMENLMYEDNRDA